MLREEKATEVTTSTRARLFLDPIATRVYGSESYLLVLDSAVSEPPAESPAVAPAGAPVLATWVGSDRAQLLSALPGQAEQANLALENNYELIEAPFKTFRCRLMAVQRPGTDFEYLVSLWDTVESPTSDIPPRSVLKAEFRGFAALTLRAEVKAYCDVVGLEVYGSWREASSA